MPGVAGARAVAARAPAPKPAAPAPATSAAPRHDALGAATRTLARLAPLAGVDAPTVTLGLPGAALPPGTRAATDGRSITLAPALLQDRPDDVPRVLAHELAHVAQLRGAAGTAPTPDATPLAEAGAHAAASLMLAGHRPRIAPVAAPVPLFDSPAAGRFSVPPGTFRVVKSSNGYAIAVNGAQYKKWKDPVRELTALYVISAYPGASRETADRIAGETQGLYLESLHEGPPPADSDPAAILILDTAQAEVEQVIQRLGLRLRRAEPSEGTFPLGPEQQAGGAKAGASRGKPGSGPPVPQFDPDGKLEFRPPRDPFITKADVHAAFYFTGDDEGRLYNYYPFYTT